MICRLDTKEERRKARLMFFKDDVYIIAHKALQKVPCSMCLEEIFCTAEKLAHYLLTHEITDEDFIDYEVDDFEDACDDKEALFLILSVAYVKLCALRKVNPVAREVARALVHRCQAYEGFTELLGALAKVEHKYMVDKGRMDLLNYELKSIAGNDSLDEYAEQRISEYVNAALDCDADVIKNVIVSFTKYNEKFNRQYSGHLSVLTQGYTDKLNGKEARKIIIESAEFRDATFGSMYDVHDNENVHTR